MVFDCCKLVLNYFKIFGALNKIIIFFLKNNNEDNNYYYFVEDATNPKSQKALGDIIASKVRFHAMLQKVKDSNFSQFQPKSMPENTVERVAMTVNEGKELKDAVLDGGVVCGAISEACPTSQFQPEFSATKPDGSSPLMRLPIEFVRSTLEEPVGYHATIGSKRKSKNKRKARKKLCMENR